MSIFKNGINIPKIVKKLKLEGYAPELKDESIRVWINPTLAIHDEYARIQLAALDHTEKRSRILSEFEGLDAKKDKDKVNQLNKDLKSMEKSFASLNKDFYEWYSDIWSQHKLEDTHASPAQVKEIAESSLKQDGGVFWGWITKNTQAMIVVHRNQHLKN